MSAPKLRALLSLCVLIGTGVYGTGFWIFRDRGPAAELFPRATAIIRGGHRPRDLIFLVPFYATRAREYLGDLHPLAVRDPLLEDLDVHARAWVFGLFEEGEKLRARMEARGYARSMAWAPAPGITVDLYDLAPTMRVVYDFADQIRSARVFHEKGGERMPCARWVEPNEPNEPNGRTGGGAAGALGRWSCPYDSEWFYVAPEWHRMGDHLRLCLWAHPPNEGRLLIEFPDVPMTGHLHGRAGHTLNASRFARERIDLDVEVQDLPPQRFSFALAEHFRPFALKTPSTGTGTVTFAISSPDAGANHFCFVADMRAPEGSASQ